jgi:DNA-binding NarL/FixJ family response regulator
MAAKQKYNKQANNSQKASTFRKIRLAIADDSVSLQNALVSAFDREPEIEIVLLADNGKDLLAKLKVVKHLPDVILMDIRMPGMNGIVATDNVLQKYPSCKVIAFSLYDNDTNLIEMYMHGAKGFVSKGKEFSEVIKAIKMVYEGMSYVTADALNVIQEYLSRIKLTNNQTVTLNIEIANQLSPFELKILYHTAEFKSLKQISDTLNRSPATINNRQAGIRKKLGLKGTKSLLQFAVVQIETIKYLLKAKK